MRINRLAATGVVFLVVGLVFAGAAGKLVIDARAFEHRATPASGTVVELVAGSGGGSYAPVVEFAVGDGSRHRVTGTVFSSPPSFEEGERVRVLFTDANPDAGVIDTLGQRFFLPVFFGAFGVLFAAVGGGLVAVPWWRRRPRASNGRPWPRVTSVWAIVGATFGPIALILLVVGGLMVRSTLRLRAEATQVTGTVVGLERGRRGLTTAIVEFPVGEGRTVRVASGSASNPPAFDVGERVPVLYREGHARDASLATFGELWLFPILVTFMGLVFGLVATAMVVLARSEARRSRGRRTLQARH